MANKEIIFSFNDLKNPIKLIKKAIKFYNTKKRFDDSKIETSLLLCEISIPGFGELKMYEKLNVSHKPSTSNGPNKKPRGSKAPNWAQGLIKTVNSLKNRFDSLENRFDKVESILDQHTAILDKHSEIFKRNNLK